MKAARSNLQEAEKSPASARGPPRGGSGGPCDHCERTYSPCWRKGPPEKPLLCNACGAHYLVKKSLDGYRPGQKGARAQQQPLAKKPPVPLKRPKKKGASLLGEAAAGDESPSDGGSPGGSAGKGGRKASNSEPTTSGGKRKRTANRRYQDGNEDSDDGTASRSLQKPMNLSLSTGRKQEPQTESFIASTPMAIHLLADMADRRKKQAPPPIWELTSPRGIEGARQRTFNALMKSPPLSNSKKVQLPHPKGSGEDAGNMPTPSKVQLQHQHLQLQLQLQLQQGPGGLFSDAAGGSIGGGPSSSCDPDSFPEEECEALLGSSLLEEHPYMKDTVLHAPDSPLPMVDMTDIVNASTWESVVTLPPSSSGAGGAVDIASLSTLVPECDRDLTSVGFVKDTMFSSPAFASAMENFQGLLASGSFDKDTSASMIINKVDDADMKRLPRIGSLESMIIPLPLNGSLQSVVKKSEAVPLFAHDSPLSCTTLQTSLLVPGAFSLNGSSDVAADLSGVAAQQQQQKQQKVMMGAGGIDGSKTPLASSGLLVPAPVTPLAIPQASAAGR